MTNLRNQYLFGSLQMIDPSERRNLAGYKPMLVKKNEEALGELQEKIDTQEQPRENGRCGSQGTSRGVDPWVV